MEVDSKSSGIDRNSMMILDDYMAEEGMKKQASQKKMVGTPMMHRNQPRAESVRRLPPIREISKSSRKRTDLSGSASSHQIVDAKQSAASVE